MGESTAFEFDGGRVEPGEGQQFRFPTSETYLGDPIRIPVTIINGENPGPTVFLGAALHGDELNGIEVVREVAHEWKHSDVHGTIVCLPVLNVPGFLAQERYLPGYEQDLNRAFPGGPDGTNDRRIAHEIYRNFVEPCDFGIDFHTSTRGRTNMLHVRADMLDPDVARLANAFGTNLIIAGRGAPGMLRREATERGTPTITIEMGEAHRFERDLIEHALDGVRSVFAEYGLYQQELVRWPGWRTVVETDDERTWIRSDEGGLVDMRRERGELVYEDETICSVSDPFKRESVEVLAPFTGLLVGVLENPVVYPGNPLCHLVEVEATVRRSIEMSSQN
ncbi:succinylglutamate desuccinylase/aspartoacylase family protein [Haladaptatus sp. AB643]|uniref:succinylglutamate desuccinylase/aspartoacylase family protein n=1 Tax=Haladaptatus sp. AB643 TaxID=2934174 RepID=UPI00209BC791|nr:succinylglutamate desuccinylase/aspartoacylase family protein [Haladaptatus sp. AB643]MCO8246330.1 succinylglutamate desuccinylase/aspartoacylase family protein [Haladaptatus sp. AB643]